MREGDLRPKGEKTVGDEWEGGVIFTNGAEIISGDEGEGGGVIFVGDEVISGDDQARGDGRVVFAHGHPAPPAQSHPALLDTLRLIFVTALSRLLAGMH